MLKQILLFIFVSIFLYSCKGDVNKRKNLGNKNAAIADFKSKMFLLMDSSNKIFERALQLLEDGVNKDSVKKLVQPTLEEMRYKLDSITRNFYIISKRFHLDSAEYNGTVHKVKAYGISLLDNYEKLKWKGVDIAK